MCTKFFFINTPEKQGVQNLLNWQLMTTRNVMHFNSKLFHKITPSTLLKFDMSMRFRPIQ